MAVGWYSPWEHVLIFWPLLWVMIVLVPVFLLLEEPSLWCIEPTTHMYVLPTPTCVQQGYNPLSQQLSCVNTGTLLEAWWRIYAAVKCVIFGLDYSLLPIWCQAIIWSNNGSLSNESLGTNFSETRIKMYHLNISDIISLISSILQNSMHDNHKFVLNMHKNTQKRHTARSI